MDITVKLDNAQMLEAIYEDGDIIYEIIKDEAFGEYFKEATITYLSNKDLSLNIILANPENDKRDWHIKYAFEEILDIFKESYWDTDTPATIDKFISGLGGIIEKLKTARNKCIKKVK